MTSKSLARAKKPRRPPIVLHLRREAIDAAIVVLFLYGIVEASLRVKDSITEARRGARPYSIRSVTHDGTPYADDDGQIALTTDPHLVYRAVPNQKNDVVTVNGDGFRGAPWRHEKPAGTKRVVVLGGSAAFGMGVSGDSKVFTVVLERALAGRARANGGDVDVLNAGVIGYDSSQELVLLATKLVDVAPDVVILFDGWNDFRSSGMVADPESALFHPKFTERDGFLARREQPFFEVVRRLEIFRSLEDGVGRWARKLARDDGAVMGEGGRYGEFFDHSDLALPRYERNLRAMARLARAFGATPLFAPQPELFQRAVVPPGEMKHRGKHEKDGYGAYARAVYPRFVAAAAAVATAESAPFVDCTKAFDGVADEAFTDLVHMSDRGNELLAEFLEPVVAKALEFE